MGLKSTAILATAAGLGGGAGVAAFALSGATSATTAIGGVVAAGCSFAIGQIQMLRQERTQLEKAIQSLQADIVAVVERQALAQAKMGEIERRTIESPALVWRAATADIEVLGSLVSDLATSVAEHDRRLNEAVPAALSADTTLTCATVVAPEPPSPELYEDEAELGFTADAVEISVPPPFQPPSKAVMAELKTTLATALASERLELCLQPVVSLPQRKTNGYEASLRLKGENGDVQNDAELRRIAAATSLEPELDRVLLERAVQVLRILRARNRDVKAVLEVAGSSLTDPVFTGSVETLLRSDPALAKAVTLEISNSDLQALGDAGRDTIVALGAKGIGFGLKRLPDLRIDMAEIEKLAFRQIRVTAQLMLAAAKDGSSASDIHPADLAEFLQRRNVDLLVADVKSEQMVLDLLDFAAPLAQGPLFGAARPVRPEVLEPKAVEPAGSRSAARQAPEKAAPVLRGQRQSFRSLLRRA